MGKATGFKEYSRETAKRRPVEERVGDYFEIYLPMQEETRAHASGALHGLRNPLLPYGLPG